MSNEVYANMMELSCKAASGKSICAFPDVCFTPPTAPPTPPGVPIPYPNTGMSSDTSGGSKTVKISGKECMVKNKSYFKKSMGDEAGCAPKKGIVNSKIQGKVYFNSWSMDVKIEGENVVRHMDMTTHNHASQIGNESAPFPHVERVAPSADAKVKPCDPPACNQKKKAQTKKELDKLRHKKEYTAAGNRVNAVPKPANCPLCNSSVDKLSPDHIVPIKIISQMPGFACLSKEDQNKVVNQPKNFVGICISCNKSKQDTLWHKWKENRAKGVEFSDKLRERGQKVTGALIYNMKGQIRSMECEAR